MQEVPAMSGAPDVFHEEFHETLAEVLNLRTWRSGRNVDEEYRQIEAEVRRAVAQETVTQKILRERFHPMLAAAEKAPPGAGVYRVPAEEIVAVQRGLLFNGAVEACDGTCQRHDTLAMTIHQIGVCLVSYHGDGGSWLHRLFRRDLHQHGADPEQAVLALLERRKERGGLHETERDKLSELARRGVMSYIERAVLARCSKAQWRMGHGSPAPLELVGARFTDLVVESIKVIRALVDHGRFVFVASEPDDLALLTLGQSLHPTEYAVIGTLAEWVAPHLEQWSPVYPATVDLAWDGLELPPREWVRRFRDQVAPRVVYGLYRATELAPPQMFFAHVDHAAVAARIALADSVLREERGFPLLIDLADRQCRSIYGGGSLREMAETAYAAAGAPFRYGSERSTR
jgi:hypothetical protein